jgi:hypothetical protein
VSDASVLEAVALLSPRTLARARRMMLAASLLRSGLQRREVVALVKVRCACGRREAYRVVSFAHDMVGEP